MKTSNIIEARRQKVNPEIRRMVDLSFKIVDRIHEILKAKGLKQKDLALRLGKKESEISRWMRGTHNFTIDTLIAIEDALGEPIIAVCHPEITCESFRIKENYLSISQNKNPPSLFTMLKSVGRFL